MEQIKFDYDNADMLFISPYAETYYSNTYGTLFWRLDNGNRCVVKNINKKVYEKLVISLSDGVYENHLIGELENEGIVNAKEMIKTLISEGMIE